MKSDTPLQPSDDPDFFDRESEAAWAKKNHFPTRLLGLILILGVILSVVGSFWSKSQFDMGGILFLIAGFSIRGGSQAWLRFVTFITGCAAILGPVDIAWTIIIRDPFLIEGSPDRWISWDEWDFWIQIIAATGYFIGLATLGAICIRTRRLEFWTGATRIWGGILLTIVLISAAFSLYETLKGFNQTELKSRYKSELDALRSYVTSHGTSHHSGFSPPVLDDLAANPAILRVSLRGSPNSGLRLYDRSTSAHATPDGETTTHTEFVRTSSGDWTQIEMEVSAAEE